MSATISGLTGLTAIGGQLMASMRASGGTSTPHIDQVFRGNKMYKEVAPDTYVAKLATGETVTVTQPGGKGSDLHVEVRGQHVGTMEFDVGFEQTSSDNFTMDVELPNSGLEMSINYDRGADGQWKVIDVNFEGEKLSPADAEKMANELMQELNNSIADSGKSKKKKPAGGDPSASQGAPQTGSTEAGGGGGGINLGEGESWFMLLAIAMGNLMNEKAVGLKDLLRQIEEAGDEPPFALTARFNALSQELNFMQSAFMNALNSIGATIKGFVEAGGASR